MTFARGSYLGMGVSLIFMFLLFLHTRGKDFIKQNKKILIVVLVVIILITLLFVIPTSLSRPDTVIYLHQDMLDKGVIRLKQAISYQRNEKSMVPLYSQLGQAAFD